VAWEGSRLQVETDELGIFRVPLAEHLPLGQHAELAVTTEVGGRRATHSIDTRTVARGLRELPPVDDRLDLGGSWAFLPGRVPDPSANAWRDAATTRVPGHVAFDGLIPDGGVATLRRTIDLPAAWTGSAVFARFDGAYGRAEVFVNGSIAGVHSAGATSFDVDLSPFLAAGESVLTIVLTEYTPHSVLDYMSWYAHVSLLGIWREAFLFRVPTTHLGPLDLNADWDPDNGVGTLTLGTQMINLDEVERSYELEISVVDNGRVVAKSTVSGTVGARSSDPQRTVVSVSDANPWSAEIPRLYDLELVLRLGDGRSQAYRRRIGFRRVEVRGNQLLVNGAPIIVRGVNRHDARLLTGRSMTTDILRHDVLALRQANVNIIRTAHYPADPRLLDLCDELGMYVQDQSPICFAAGFDDHHWTRTNDAAHLVPYVLEVTAETVGRDQGHPSVIIWDLANEALWGWGFDVQLAVVRQMDPSRPTLFSFDLNQLGDDNPLPARPRASRPDIRTYHYPGWDRSWREDLDWLRSYDQPAILDECSPPFQDNTRDPLQAEALAIDPGVHDYWVVGVKPFMERALQDHGCIGGMIWSAVDDQFVLPLDESIGEGAWAHLTKLDYFRVRDVHPPQGGLVFRGEGEWGFIDGWGRIRPEMWHMQKLYSPIAIADAEFTEAGDQLELGVANRFAHRSLDSLDVRIEGATFAASSKLGAAPGEIDRVALDVQADARAVELAFWHPEGWLTDAYRWEVPRRAADPHAEVRAVAEPLTVRLGATGELESSGAEPWLSSWPRLHVQDANHPLTPVAVPAPALDRAAVAADGSVSVPLAGPDWSGSISIAVDGERAIVDYQCTYTGDEAIDAREIGLAFDTPAGLTDLWWHRVGDWSHYPDGHIGREHGYAPSAPGPGDPLHPADRWEQDTTPAGTNDYRSAKRSILVGGATDGNRSLSVLSDGSQHLRAMLVEGRQVLHVLDWSGGVTAVPVIHPIWSGYFGFGRRIERGTELRGRVVLTGGALPAGALE
jgi:beta-galactosidase